MIVIPKGDDETYQEKLIQELRDTVKAHIQQTAHLSEELQQELLNTAMPYLWLDRKIKVIADKWEKGIYSIAETFKQISLLEEKYNDWWYSKTPAENLVNHFMAPLAAKIERKINNMKLAIEKTNALQDTAAGTLAPQSTSETVSAAQSTPETIPQIENALKPEMIKAGILSKDGKTPLKRLSDISCYMLNNNQNVTVRALKDLGLTTRKSKSYSDRAYQDAVNHANTH